jgi:D-sedoheptulose 7-phosphate isomerase
MGNKSDINKIVKNFLEVQIDCIKEIQEQSETIDKIIKIIISTKNKNKTIFTMGNGGSGSTASHFASDLQKTTILKNENRIKSISLVDNMPLILAWANDVSFESIFEEQLKNYIEKGDVVIAFSGSGKSKNVVNALKFAKKQGAKCIGFTGKSGGHFNNICDVIFKIQSNDMLTIESQHVTVSHCIISAIRNLGKPLFRYD